MEEITELRIAQVKTEGQIQFLADKMGDIHDAVKELKRSNDSLQEITQRQAGVLKFLTWGVAPFMALVVGVGGYFKTDYDSTNKDQFEQIHANATKLENLDQRVTTIEFKSKLK